MPIGNMLANFGNRGGLLTRMEQSRGIGIRNNLNEYALGSAIRAENKQNRLGELYSKALGGDQGAAQEMAGLDPEFHMQLQTKIQALNDAQRKQLLEENEQYGRMLYMAKDNPQALQQLGLTPEQANMALLKSTALSESLFKTMTESPYQNISVDDAGVPYGFNKRTGTYDRLPGAQQFQNPPSGMAVDVGPDGTVSFRQGPGMGGLQKPTLNKIEEKQLNATEALSRLNTINQSFKPGFATFGGRFEAFFSGMKDKAGLKLSKDEATNLREFSTYRRDAISHLNRTLNELSGAAVSPAEEERLKAELPDPGTGLFDGDGPTEFKAKADASTRAMKQAVIRYHYAKRSGMDPFAIDLADVDKLMDQRGSELEAQLSSQNPGMDPVTIDAMVKDQLSREFGIQ